MTMPTPTEPLQLSVSNFGPIAKAEIDLRPLTVFVGPSNTGKSYLAILIYALHRFSVITLMADILDLGECIPFYSEASGNSSLSMMIVSGG